MSTISIQRWSFLWLALLCLGAQAATDLSPNQNGNSGDIPGNYSDLVFTVSDGNWVSLLTLPTGGQDKAQISIVSKATYKTGVSSVNTDVPIGLSLAKGEAIKFVFNANAKQWQYTSSNVYSWKTSGSTVPGMYSQKIIQYRLSKDDFSPIVSLPTGAPNGALISVIAAEPSYVARIDPGNVMFASSLNVRPGDRYFFMYRSDLEKWVLLAGAQQMVGPGPLPVAMVPITLIQVSGSQASDIFLPAKGGDRDRVIIQSSSSRSVPISNNYVDYPGTLQIQSGQRYEFMYIKDKGTWTVVDAPKVSLTPANLINGQMPDQVTPVTIFTLPTDTVAGYGSVQLPSRAKTGDRVVIKTTADAGLRVASGSVVIATVQPGETARFQRSASNAWVRETTTVTMLLVYSDQAAAALGGATASVARLAESLRLTNQALENSNVNLYVQGVGYLQKKITGSTLSEVLNNGKVDTLVQSTRNSLKADTVYYEGTEDGCGLAFVVKNISAASASSMLATGSLSCGTAVMRHEFGHNMGLAHNDKTNGRTIYSRGYARASEVKDVMGGNSTPYYSTPLLYESAIGLARGTAADADAVRAMNEVSARAAALR